MPTHPNITGHTATWHVGQPMGPFAKFRYQLLTNLFRGLNTLWQVFGVIIADPIDIFDASAWEGLLAALIAAGLAATRQFLMDVTGLVKELVLKTGVSVTNLSR